MCLMFARTFRLEYFAAQGEEAHESVELYSYICFTHCLLLTAFFMFFHGEFLRSIPDTFQKPQLRQCDGAYLISFCACSETGGENSNNPSAKCCQMNKVIKTDEVLKR